MSIQHAPQRLHTASVQKEHTHMQLHSLKRVSNADCSFRSLYNEDVKSDLKIKLVATEILQALRYNILLLRRAVGT